MAKIQLTSAPAGLDEGQRAVAELAYEIGQRYADGPFDDVPSNDKLFEDVVSAGFIGLNLPEEYGGSGTMSDLVLVMERIAAGGFNPSPMVLSSIVGGMLSKHGTPEQKSYWVPRIISGDARFSFALTEPQTGSNAMNMKTSATLTNGTWHVKGEKTYISGLERATAVVLVSQDKTHGGLAAFIFDLPHPGFEFTLQESLAENATRQANVFIDIELPETAYLGTPETGGAKGPLFAGLNPERLVVGAMSIGVGRWCLNRAVEYANQRVVFTNPIGTHQALAHPLAESYIALEGGWSLLWRAAELYDMGAEDGVATNVAKIAACDAGYKAADSSLQVFGGSGYMAETNMFPRFAFMRLQHSVPVSRQMGLNHVAQAIGLPKSY